MIVSLLILLIIALSYGLYRSVSKNLELLESLEELSTQIEESLDILDDCYKNIQKKSELEIFIDEPVVKDLINDINNTKDAVLLIANKLYGASQTKPPTSSNDEQ